MKQIVQHTMRSFPMLKKVYDYFFHTLFQNREQNDFWDKPILDYCYENIILRPSVFGGIK